MIKTYCGICGKEISVFCTVNYVVIDERDDYPYNQMKYDVCSKCSHKIQEWIRDQIVINKNKMKE